MFTGNAKQGKVGGRGRGNKGRGGGNERPTSMNVDRLPKKKTAPMHLGHQIYGNDNLSHQDFGENTSALADGHDPMKPLSDH